MDALFDLFDELAAHELRAARVYTARLGAKVNPFHQVVRDAGYRVLEPAIELRAPDRGFKFLLLHRTGLDHRHRSQSGAGEHRQSCLKTKKRSSILVVNIELEKVMRQITIVNRMPCIHPLAEQNEIASKHLFKHRALHHGPLLEEVVLRMHPLGDKVPALKRDSRGLRGPADLLRQAPDSRNVIRNHDNVPKNRF